MTRLIRGISFQFTEEDIGLLGDNNLLQLVTFF